MAINERLVHTASAAAASGGNQEEGLILHLDANDVDSYDGDGTEWVDIANHEYKPTTNVSEHFNTVTYTGNGASNPITGVGFQPDLIWVKRRTTSTANHYIVDTVRGNGTSTYKNLSSNTTDAEGTTTTSGITNSTIVDGGFTMQGTGARTNASGSTYVAWCFKAGGAAVSNTDGTVTSQVSANNDLGFSIVKYTGTTSADDVGHGLDVAPNLVIAKSLDSSDSNSNWIVSATPVGGQRGILNGTQSFSASTTHFRTDPDSTVLKLSSHSSSNVNRSGDEHIAYCFASKRGVSKVGSYTGTGAAGNKVYTGFEPAFVMVKASNYVENWIIYDNKRSTDDPRNEVLLPASSSAELSSTNYNIDFDRDGFTINSIQNFINLNGTNYIYLAFAKDTNETELHDTDLELHLDAASFDGSTNTPTTWTALTGSSATLNNGILFDSELGNYLHLDGGNDTITTTNSYTYVNQTWEFWINPDVIERAYLWTNYGTGTIPEGAAYLEMTSTGTIEAGIRDGGSTVSNTSSTSLSAGKWYHIAITSDGSNFKLYINGESEGASSISITSVASNSQNLVFGYDPRNIRLWFDGKIGQFRAYSSALTQDQIRQNFNFTKNDYPNGYNGTIGGATWNSGGYFDFDGSNDYIDLGDIKGTGSELTVSAWINPDSTQSNAYATVFDFEHSNDEGWVLYQDNTSTNNYKVALKEGSVWDSTSNISLSSGNWHHIAFTIDYNNDFELYVNNTNIQSLQNWGGLGTAEKRLNLGCWGGANGTTRSRFWNGQMTEMKVYDKALTQAEITALYNEGE